MNCLYRMIVFMWMTVAGLGTACHTQAADAGTGEPDSVYTEEYIVNISVSEPQRALKLIDETGRRRRLPGFHLDFLRSIVYQNGFSMFRMALDYSLRAYRNDSLHRNPDDALRVLELITDQYNMNGNYTESMRYAVEGAELARRTGNTGAEANLLLYIGINKRNMGLKSEAAAYVEKALQLQQQIAEGSREWKAVDDLIYIYGMKLTYAYDDEKFGEAVALLPRYGELMERLKACPDTPKGLHDMRLASIHALSASLFAVTGQTEKSDECYRKYLATDYSATDDGKQMRFDYLIARKRYKDALRYIGEDKRFQREQTDTVNLFYVERDLGLEAQAYMGLGDYKSAAHTYRQMYVLLDSLRIREKQNGALELAAIYETKEKDMLLQKQAADARTRNIWLGTTGGAALLLGVLLWFTVRHNRTIRRKNGIMVKAVQELLSQKEELYAARERIRILSENRYTDIPEAADAADMPDMRHITVGPDSVTPDTANMPDCMGVSGSVDMQNAAACMAGSAEVSANAGTGADTDAVADIGTDTDTTGCDKRPVTPEEEENRRLFGELDGIVTREKLFLNPDLNRDELARLICVNKNRFGNILQQNAGMSATGYINNKRLEYAARLMDENPLFTVTAIAVTCGIPNAPTFHRLFRSKFGMTPAEYKKGMKSAEKEAGTGENGQSDTYL